MMCLINLFQILYLSAIISTQMYLEGESVVEQNNETALQYFKKAVEQVCSYPWQDCNLCNELLDIEVNVAELLACFVYCFIVIFHGAEKCLAAWFSMILDNDEESNLIVHVL